MVLNDLRQQLIENSEGIDGHVIFFALQLVQLAGLKQNEIPNLRIRDAFDEVGNVLAGLNIAGGTILLSAELRELFSNYRQHLVSLQQSTSPSDPLFPGYGATDSADKAAVVAKKKQFTRDIEDVLGRAGKKIYSTLHKDGIKELYDYLRSCGHDEKQAIQDTADYFRLSFRNVRDLVLTGKTQPAGGRSIIKSCNLEIKKLNVKKLGPDYLPLAFMDVLHSLDFTNSKQIKKVRKGFKKWLGVTTDKDFSTIEKLCTMIARAPNIAENWKPMIIEKIIQEIGPRIERQKNPPLESPLAPYKIPKTITPPTVPAPPSFANTAEPAQCETPSTPQLSTKSDVSAESRQPHDAQDFLARLKAQGFESWDHYIESMGERIVLEETEKTGQQTEPVKKVRTRREDIPYGPRRNNKDFKNKNFREIIALMRRFRDNRSLRKKDDIVTQFNTIMDYINFSEYWGTSKEKRLVQAALNLLDKRYKRMIFSFDDDSLELYSIKNKSAKKASQRTIPKPKLKLRGKKRLIDEARIIKRIKTSK